MNSVNLIGRLTKDPEARQGQNTTVVNFTLAIDRIGQDNGADFIRCVAFGKTAEFIDDYFTKGLRVAVSGRIQTGSYENKDGQTVYTTDVIAERVEFADGKKDKPDDSKGRRSGNDRQNRRR